MQAPTQSTKVAKCIALGTYASRMMSKFPQDAVLVMLSQKVGDATAKLEASQNAYIAAVKAILLARVDVKFENYRSDKRVWQTKRKTELFDGKVNGAVGSRVFPDGVTPIIKPVGETQVTEMLDLEGRLEAAAPQWPEAMTEKADIMAHRTDYETALKTRRAAGQKASDLRAARDVVKEDFLNVYAEAAGRIKALFPRDKAAQDLFFDEVRARSKSNDAGDDTDDDADEDEGG